MRQEDRDPTRAPPRGRCWPSNCSRAAPGITADRLADKLGVSERAARRYVAILREAGIPIESVRGPYGGYRVGRGLRLPPLMFSADGGARPGHGRARRPPRRRRSRPTRSAARSARSCGRCRSRWPPRPRRSAGPPRPRPTAAPPGPTRRPPPPSCRPARTTGGCGSATAPRPGRSGSPRSTRGRSSYATAGGTCCAGRTRRDARRAYRIDRVRGVEVLDDDLRPTRRPRPGRHAGGAPRRRLGVRRRGGHRRARRRRRRARLPRALGRLEPLDAGTSRLVGSTSNPCGTPSSSR